MGTVTLTARQTAGAMATREAITPFSFSIHMRTATQIDEARLQTAKQRE
ncbi:hypothetical protein CLV36_102173 [Laceyella sediminis]|jgi:hypothetical protein|uniref:Uncharacterized protein n=2 Tax=Laceyella TaxID=292635 RepID=A0AA45WQQ1_9BACL|nr:hypothetical protein CLV36_102173 [Laceyella sediminis]SMP26794.1 hypothetical protein SAMN06265361_105206 [Laceyella tengchongensis]